MVLFAPEPLSAQLEGTPTAEFMRNVPALSNTNWFVPQDASAALIPEDASTAPLPYVEACIVEPDCGHEPDGMPPGMPDELQSIARLELRIGDHSWPEE
jgi:hypothetical protein